MINSQPISSEFIVDYECTNTELGRFTMLDARKSFPSGHSSLSVFQAIFTAWYLQMRFSRYTSSFTILFLQFVVLCWGVYCPISRITDYRHHWWDALTGAVLGVIFAALTVSLLTIVCLAEEDYYNCPFISHCSAR